MKINKSVLALLLIKFHDVSADDVSADDVSTDDVSADDSLNENQAQSSLMNLAMKVTLKRGRATCYPSGRQYYSNLWKSNPELGLDRSTLEMKAKEVLLDPKCINKKYFVTYTNHTNLICCQTPNNGDSSQDSKDGPASQRNYYQITEYESCEEKIEKAVNKEKETCSTDAQEALQASKDALIAAEAKVTEKEKLIKEANDKVTKAEKEADDAQKKIDSAKTKAEETKAEHAAYIKQVKAKEAEKALAQANKAAKDAEKLALETSKQKQAQVILTYNAKIAKLFKEMKEKDATIDKLRDELTKKQVIMTGPPGVAGDGTNNNNIQHADVSMSKVSQVTYLDIQNQNLVDYQQKLIENPSPYLI